MIQAFAGLAIGGALVALASAWLLRFSGASPSVGRRLAGAPGATVTSLVEGSAAPRGTVRVSGRIRCGDAIRAEGGERLVLLHGDVEVRVGDRWRSIERQRETRSFELWDRRGSLSLDPATAAEPVVVIPKVWRGSVDALPEPLASAARRAGESAEARMVIRSINVTDELLVLARVRRDPDGNVRLEPPPGGYLITNLALDDAMRLLGGRHRRVAALAIVGIGLGVVVAVVATLAALLAIAFS